MLKDFWRAAQFRGMFHVHPCDEALFGLENGSVRSMGTFARFAACRTNDGDWFGGPKSRLHLELMPVPYVGDLSKATVFILQLNLHAKPSDICELDDVRFAEALGANLTQTLSTSVTHPFLWLDPRFSAHSGYEWWVTRLRRIIDVIAKERFSSRNPNEAVIDAQRFLANNIAHIELVPYRSQRFGGPAAVLELPSVRAARAYVETVLLPMARADECTVIVTRSWDKWRVLKECANVISSKHVRSVWFPPEAKLGLAILNRLRAVD